MKRLIPLFLVLFLFASSEIIAQDTLPKFSLRNVGNKRILIGWVNKFETVKQISIQRSPDSTRNFRTILSVADPMSPENGYADTKAATDSMYYRLYIQLDNGAYIFSESRRPVWDTIIAAPPAVAGAGSGGTVIDSNEYIYTPQGRLQRPGNNNGGNYTSVIPNDPNGAPVMATDNRPKAERWAPSKFVYTFRDGYIRITLPDNDKKYDIKFFTMEDEPLFELKDVKEKNFKLDKSSFYRSGWFKFELYEDGELKEKNRFLLPKEF